MWSQTRTETPVTVKERWATVLKICGETPKLRRSCIIDGKCGRKGRARIRIELRRIAIIKT